MACEVLPRAGAWRHAQVLRVERGGVVLRTLGPPLEGGADVRCWVRVDGVPYTFEASVLRSGVPIPDRSQAGVLLGFLDGWRRADDGRGGLVLEALPANGRPVDLLDGEARLVDLHPDEWTLTAPTRFTLVFVEGSAVRLRLGLPDRAPLEVGARVRRLSRGDGHLLYGLSIERVEDPARYGELLAAVRVALGL